MPSCWKKQASERKTPQVMPPLISLLLYIGSSLPRMLGRLPFILSNNRQQPVRKMVASTLRAQLKVKGSAYSPPTLCAIKAVPQMKAHNVSIKIPLRLSLPAPGLLMKYSPNPNDNMLFIVSYFACRVQR